MNGLKEVTVKKYIVEEGRVLLKPESHNMAHQQIIFTGGDKPHDLIQLDQVDISLLALVVGEYRQL